MKLNKSILIIVAAVFAAIVMIIVGINSIPANAIAYEEKVTEAQSAIKVQEKRRADLLPYVSSDSWQSSFWLIF